MTDADRIARALLTPGGHLAIGRGGCVLRCDDARVSRCGCDDLKRAAINAGLPVINTRTVPFEIALNLAVQGPLVAVGRDGGTDRWHGFVAVPLAVLATVYRQVGADIHNIENNPPHRSMVRGPVSCSVERADRSLAGIHAWRRRGGKHRHRGRAVAMAGLLARSVGRFAIQAEKSGAPFAPSPATLLETVSTTTLG